MPKISVIIPSYNCAASVAGAVDCVLSQAMQDSEVLVVDDGSSDNTSEALEPYFSSGRFRYFSQRNRGPSAARNWGVQASDSEYVFFLDADDALAPEALASISSALDVSGAGWCLVDTVKMLGPRREVWPIVWPNGDLFLGILREDFIRCPMFFRRRTFIEMGMYDENLRCREDWDVNIRMLERQVPFVYLNQPLYIYVRREGSQTTGNPSRVLADTEAVLRKHHKRLADGGNRGVAKIYAQNMWNLGRRYFYTTGTYRRAFACMGESLVYDRSPSRVFHPFIHHVRRLIGKDVKSCKDLPAVH